MRGASVKLMLDTGCLILVKKNLISHRHTQTKSDKNLKTYSLLDLISEYRSASGRFAFHSAKR